VTILNTSIAAFYMTLYVAVFGCSNHTSSVIMTRV